MEGGYNAVAVCSGLAAINAALCALLSELLRVPKRAIAITQGQQSKLKTVRIKGVSEAQVRALAADKTSPSQF